MAHSKAQTRIFDASKSHGSEQDRKYPYAVVGVSWEDAEKFCEWLTEHERGSEGLPAGVHYRLPTDEEWRAVLQLYR